MEINLPDRGVFAGMGKLETAKVVNRKYFPNLRNINQFQYTHDHANQYKTSFQSFRPYDKKEYIYHKVNRNSNESQVVLGNDKTDKIETENRHHFRKYNFSLPPKPIRQTEQGVGINEYEQRTGQKITYSTTSNQNFNAFKKVNEHQNIKYKYSRTDRFNPITGEHKANTSFGFEDFVPMNNRLYKANNFTLIPNKSEKYDIISGRKLPPF